MKKRKVYRPPSPKAPEPLPSKIDIDKLEKSLRAAVGGYYEAYPVQRTEVQKSWLERKNPGILKRFREMRDRVLPKHKKIPP